MLALQAGIAKLSLDCVRKLRAKYPACEEEFPLARIPSTRYQGSKRKILRWLFPIFKSLSFDSALDAFGGTGSVSYLLKGMGKAVTYNDVLQFNFLIGLAIIENEDVLLSGDEVNNLLSKPRKCPPGFVTATFRRFYFKDEENKRIDEVAFNARELNDGTKKARLNQPSPIMHFSRPVYVNDPSTFFIEKTYTFGRPASKETSEIKRRGIVISTKLFASLHRRLMR